MKIENKTKKALEFFKSGDFKSALRIAKTFRMGDKNDLHNVKMFWEVLQNPDFYRQVGRDIELTKKQGMISLEKLLGGDK